LRNDLGAAGDRRRRTRRRADRSVTLDGQIETGGAWVGTLAEVKAIIARVVKSIGKLERASLRINFGTIDVGEAQKSMRLFATRLALNY